MQAKREKNHNNSNHAPISTFTHNKIRPLSPVLAAPQPLAATGFEALVGYLYLQGRLERLRELFRFLQAEGMEPAAQPADSAV